MIRPVAFAIALMLANGPVSAQDWRDTATELVIQEKSVVDDMFTQRISLWVSMLDDGTRRDGFASYLCMVLFDAGMQPGDFVVIKIWDAAAIAREEIKEIGRYECARK
ncbi:hypothetical protein SAMN05877838_3507 [Hoeflea halophila]|uniref:Uncharacterized protein n=1 Tax=Hoeflea halophila TaxID=714899 RepID=A0A286IEN2_9HYPH|nr:hypothetical protein [Hoeflea halophila]SOE18578.1 hypothetical protein SAMN05877838_3507 [Hoeflea halophila]